MLKLGSLAGCKLIFIKCKCNHLDSKESQSWKHLLFTTLALANSKWLVYIFRCSNRREQSREKEKTGTGKFIDFVPTYQASLVKRLSLRIPKEMASNPYETMPALVTISTGDGL